MKNWATDTMERIIKKLDTTALSIGVRFPHACGDDVFDEQRAPWWTNGFWPGILWMAYQQTGDKKFADIAIEIENKLDIVFDEYYEVDHDAGFIWLLSAGAHYRFCKDEVSKVRCLKAASFLASRFNAKGNFIQAWNSQPGWAIIDCCMNLSLLYWASEITDNPRFKHIAQAHADTVLKYFIRPDGSVNHVIAFHPDTGEMLEPLSGQAATPYSAWSRGTAWALYGLPLSYRHTGNPEYLIAAKRIANFFVANLPDDCAAHWDFRVKRTKETPRDTSASACGACGLLELSRHVPECEKDFYINAAYKILRSLTDHYSNLDDDVKQCMIRGGTSHCPENINVNTGLIYGDYFYMEGISRLMGNTDIFWYEP